VDYVQGDDASAYAAGAIRTDPVETYRQGVARLSALDEERARLRIPTVGDPLARAVVASGIDAPGPHGVAARDVENRLVRADRDVELRRLEVMSCHGRGLPPDPCRRDRSGRRARTSPRTRARGRARAPA